MAAQPLSDPSMRSLAKLDLDRLSLDCWSLFKVRRHFFSLGRVTRKVDSELMGHSPGDPGDYCTYAMAHSSVMKE